jgi:hypothetical protein
MFESFSDAATSAHYSRVVHTFLDKYCPSVSQQLDDQFPSVELRRLATSLVARGHRSFRLGIVSHSTICLD